MPVLPHVLNMLNRTKSGRRRIFIPNRVRNVGESHIWQEVGTAQARTNLIYDVNRNATDDSLQVLLRMRCDFTVERPALVMAADKRSTCGVFFNRLIDWSIFADCIWLIISLKRSSTGENREISTHIFGRNDDNREQVMNMAAMRYIASHRASNGEIGRLIDSSVSQVAEHRVVTQRRQSEHRSSMFRNVCHKAFTLWTWSYAIWLSCECHDTILFYNS
jgi:hypothetical protein